MENKKLIKILLKDISEVEELIAEKTDGRFDPIEMELLSTRIVSARKLLTMMLESEKSIGREKTFFEKESVAIKEEIHQPVPEIIQEIPKYEPVKETFQPMATEVFEISEPAVTHIPEPITVAEPKIERPLQLETPLIPEPAQPVSAVITEPAEGGTKNLAEAMVRLGDKFTKEKSINDIGIEQNKLEFKLSNLPIANLQSAIGVNDRFLYIRELFDGNAAKYSETVAILDKMDDLKKAVGYLQENFTWKKSDTSLEFVNLVKRRFIK